MRVDYEFSTTVKCVKPAKCQRIFCQRILSWLKMSDKQRTMKESTRRKQREESGSLLLVRLIWRITCIHYGGWVEVWFELPFRSCCDLVPLAPTPLLNPLSIFPCASNIWRPKTQLATIWSSKWEHFWRDIKRFSKFINTFIHSEGWPRFPRKCNSSDISGPSDFKVKKNLNSSKSTFPFGICCFYGFRWTLSLLVVHDYLQCCPGRWQNKMPLS